MEKRKELLAESLKIIIAGSLSIWIAEIAGMSYPISAGVIAILSIRATKKETLQSVIDRALAFLVAVFFAFVVFSLTGFHYGGYLLFLLLYVPVSLWCKWKNSIAMNAVLISHFLLSQSMSFETITNELLLFLIGSAAGILVNLHLKKDSLAAEQLEEEIDYRIKDILVRMSHVIVGEEDMELEQVLHQKLFDALFEAQTLVVSNRNNEWKDSGFFDIDYVEMRKKQARLLVDMHRVMTKIGNAPKQARDLADLFRLYARSYDKSNTAGRLHNQFLRIREEMRKEPLPVTREEFESRALLFALLQYMEDFLLLKKEFATKYYDMHEGGKDGGI